MFGRIVAVSLALLAAPISAQVPRLEPMDDCHVQVDAAFEQDVECGWLIVPETPGIDGGATVRLAYAVARAAAANPEPDPIIFIRGGPGVSNLAIMNRELGRSPWTELRQRRDLLFLDQRGTGFSEPVVCPAINDVWVATDYLVVPDEEFNAALARTGAACADSMAAEGRDIGAYNATSVARDLDDLRRLLGYEQWNVQGHSYGGRYTQILMSHNPDAIRSVVLSSPVPMGAMSRTVALHEALNLIFEQCRADAACNTAFPDLEQQFIALMERLEAEPVRFEVPSSFGLPDDHLVVNRRSALRHIQMDLYHEQLAPVLPLIIAEAARGNTAALFAFLPPESWRWGPNPYAEGLALASICYDDAGKPYTQDAAVRSSHPHLTFTDWYWARLEVCNSVHQARASERERSPPEAPIPTLVLGGGYDPTVPPSTIRHTAGILPNAQLAFAPALGHVGASSSPCMSGLTTAFFENPQAALDTTCLADHASIPFVTSVRRVRGSARLNTWFSPYFALHTPQGMGESAAFVTWVNLSLLGLLSALVIWPAVWLWRRIRGSARKRSPDEIRAVLLAAATSLFGILAFVLSVFAMGMTGMTNYRVLSVGVLDGFGWIFVLPWVLAALTLALVVVAVIAWRRGYWERWMRVHYTIVAVCALSLVAFMGYWPLI